MKRIVSGGVWICATISAPVRAWMMLSILACPRTSQCSCGVTTINLIACVDCCDTVSIAFDRQLEIVSFGSAELAVNPGLHHALLFMVVHSASSAFWLLMSVGCMFVSPSMMEYAFLIVVFV